jgi:cellobiose phosphorylase
MQYGYFDDQAKEYVITRPDTPLSWSNYLGSTQYGAIMTNNAGGYGFYKSGALGRFMRLRFNSIPLDQPGRYFYLRDRESGDYWSASWQPGVVPWAYYSATQYILGIRPEVNGLRLDPCIPAHWPGFKAIRQFRGKTIEIDVKNLDGICRGVKSLTLNGESLVGNLIPVEKLAESNKVLLVLG